MQKKVYVKKGEAPVEETKIEAPKKENSGAEGGSRGGRGRGGRGGRGGYEQRPYTQNSKDHERPHYVKKGEHKEEGDQKEEKKEYKEHRGGKNHREDRHRQEHDENSYYYKYYYGQRPVIDRNVKVTIETVLPEIIPKEQRKKNPDQKEFENKQK